MKKRKSKSKEVCRSDDFLGASSRQVKKIKETLNILRRLAEKYADRGLEADNLIPITHKVRCPMCNRRLKPRPVFDIHDGLVLFMRLPKHLRK